MHEISELVQFAAPVASVGGLAAIARLASARESRRRSRAINRGTLEIDTVQGERGGGEDQMVDQASMDSFPASDSPPFWIRFR